MCVVTSILAQSVRSGNFSAGRTEPFLCIEEIVPLFLFVTGALLKIAPPPFLSCSLLFIPLLSLAETPLVVQLLVVEVVVVVVVISEVVVVASPKNSSNLSLLTANTVPLSAHFPINVNASNVFSFLGNKGDEGIDGKGECDDEAMVIILMMITTLVMFR